MKRKKKQEEQELLMQQNADDAVELEEHELANQEIEEDEDMFAPSPILVKELNKEAMREVDACLRKGWVSFNCIVSENVKHLDLSR